MVGGRGGGVVKTKQKKKKKRESIDFFFLFFPLPDCFLSSSRCGLMSQETRRGLRERFVNSGSRIKDELTGAKALIGLRRKIVLAR